MIIKFLRRNLWPVLIMLLLFIIFTAALVISTRNSQETGFIYQIF